MFVMTKAINEMTIKRLEELQSPAELTSFDGLLLFYAFVGRIFAVSGGRFHVSSCRGGNGSQKGVGGRHG